jgi:hypothetical protein
MTQSRRRIAYVQERDLVGAFRSEILCQLRHTCIHDFSFVIYYRSSPRRLTRPLSIVSEKAVWTEWNGLSLSSCNLLFLLDLLTPKTPHLPGSSSRMPLLALRPSLLLIHQSKLLLRALARLGADTAETGRVRARALTRHAGRRDCRLARDRPRAAEGN